MAAAFRVPVPRGSTVPLDDAAKLRAFFEWYQKQAARRPGYGTARIHRGRRSPRRSPA